MFSQLSKLLTELAGKYRSRRRRKRSQKSTTRPHAERLEQRLALSVYVPAGAAAPLCCACPGCTGQPFATAGQAPGAAYQAPGYRWSQSAPGAPMTVTYSYSNLLSGGLG